MLPFQSPRWFDFDCAGGNPRLVLDLMGALASHPTESDWAEMWEQVSHQWSPFSIAFAALPHLIRFGIDQEISVTPEFLLGLGRTVACLAELGPPPDDLKYDLDAALREVAPIVENAAKSEGYSSEDYPCVLHAAAALSGRPSLGPTLFFSLYGSDGAELNCPHCDAYLNGDFNEDGLVFQSVNEHMQPVSAQAWVRPRAVTTTATADQADDFSWLAGLCQAARQLKALKNICHLYGSLTCPLCGGEISVMSEIQRHLH